MQYSMNEKLVKSKIVCTLGPATNTEETLKKLVAEGCDVVRLNFSHAAEDDHDMVELFNLIRQVIPEVAILCDIQGPKIRIGEMERPVTLEIGQPFILYEQEIIGNEQMASISYKGFMDDVGVDDFIFINDGLVRLQVTEKNHEQGYLQTTVIAGGEINSHKGVNIPSGQLSMKVPTPKDVRDLNIIGSLRPEYVAISFVGDASDV